MRLDTDSHAFGFFASLAVTFADSPRPCFRTRPANDKTATPVQSFDSDLHKCHIHAPMAPTPPLPGQRLFSFVDLLFRL